MIGDADILSAPILIVDDQQANVALLEQLLAGAGYTSVESIRDPREVCERHRRNHYSLILLDLQMPGMDGFEVIEALKAEAQDDYLPVLVLTAQPGHKLRALQAGAKDFVSKPFDLPEVLMRVRNMVEVRLLHLESKRHGAVLEQTLRAVEGNREVIRRQAEEVRSLYDQVVVEQKLSERLLLNVMPESIAVRPDEDIRPLIAGYLANRHQDVAALRVHLAALEYSAIGRLGHTIKETGRAYGFEGLTEIGSALERAAHHEDRETVGARITHLSEYLQRVRVME
jgi:CheY-like chemotaxis protein